MGKVMNFRNDVFLNQIIMESKIFQTLLDISNELSLVHKVLFYINYKSLPTFSSHYKRRVDKNLCNSLFIHRKSVCTG